MQVVTEVLHRTVAQLEHHRSRVVWQLALRLGVADAEEIAQCLITSSDLTWRGCEVAIAASSHILTKLRYDHIFSRRSSKFHL